MIETQIERIFGVMLPFPAHTLPWTFESVAEITHLYLADSHLTFLPSDFTTCRNLLEVDLSGNGLTEQACPIISAMMKHNKTLHTLK